MTRLRASARSRADNLRREAGKPRADALGEVPYTTVPIVAIGLWAL